jgi:two-component system nitrogen regulation sensor histidine kinase NtrY
LLFERRQKVLGSNLKTRLTLAFVALTLVPTVVLFIASAGVLHTTIERWFTTQVEDSLQSSLVVAQAYYQNASDKVMTSAARLASHIASHSMLNPAQRDGLRASVESWRVSDGISGVQVYTVDGSQSLAIKDPTLKDTSFSAPLASFLKIGFQGEKTSQIIPLDGGGDLIRGIAPIRAQGDGPVQAVVVVDYHIPTSLAGRLFAISNAYGDYQEARRMKGPVKTMYVLILLMVALLVIFVGFWFGMSMARDITDPIQSLAEGTGKIAAGDLDVYIEPVGDDEVSALVRSFNQMTADLRTNREELVRVNLDLESRRKYMETVLRNVAAGVLALNPASEVTTINHSARRLLRIADENFAGKSLDEILPETSAGPVLEILEDLKETKQESLERQITLSFSDRAVSLLCFANHLLDEEGGDLGVVLVIEDITHLAKAQRMAAWREVARRIAHEIKNPLTPIQLNAQRLRRKYTDALGNDAVVLEQCTRTIIDQVEQLKKMVNEFSQFARMPTANPVPNNLNVLISEVFDLYRTGHVRTAFSFQPDPAVPIFDLDKEQMKRVVINLMDNAVAASGDNGKITVTTRYDPILSIASIEVVDNGPGVNSRDRERLFEPYFSRRPGGTGLGLTIVSTIVSDHNGFIRVKDNPGGGAVFVIELPVKKG